MSTAGQERMIPMQHRCVEEWAAVAGLGPANRQKRHSTGRFRSQERSTGAGRIAKRRSNKTEWPTSRRRSTTERSKPQGRSLQVICAAGVRGRFTSDTVLFAYFRVAACNSRGGTHNKDGDSAQTLRSSPVNSQPLETIMESITFQRYVRYVQERRTWPGTRAHGSRYADRKRCVQHGGGKLGHDKRTHDRYEFGKNQLCRTVLRRFSWHGRSSIRGTVAGSKADTANKRFTLNATKEQLKNAPGFDKDRWPAMADTTWASDVHKFYGVKTTGRVQ